MVVMGTNMSLRSIPEVYLSKGNLGIPELDAIFVGDGDFRLIGAEFLSYLIVYGNIKRDFTIIDIGCGQGRIALPLTLVLNSEEGGRYIGVDVVEEGVSWCKRNISILNSKFEFRHVDINHPIYNPTGTLESKDMASRIEVDFFDLAILTSVFTHFDKKSIEAYVETISGCLKKRGACFLSLFLINPDRIRKKAAFNCRYSFNLVDEGPVYFHSSGERLGAVAVSEEWILELFRSKGLYLDLPILYGKWFDEGRSPEAGLSYQDILVVRKY